MPSDKGDECHRNIQGLTRRQRSQMARENFQIGNLEICDGDTHRSLTAEDIPLLGDLPNNA